MSKIEHELNHLLYHASMQVPTNILKLLQAPAVREAAAFCDRDDIAKAMLHIKLLEHISLDPLSYDQGFKSYAQQVKIAKTRQDGQTRFEIRLHGLDNYFGPLFTVPDSLAKNVRAAIDGNFASPMYAASKKSRSDDERLRIAQRSHEAWKEAQRVGAAAAKSLVSPATPQLTTDQAKKLMHWDSRRNGEVRTHVLKFHESKEAKEQLKSSMAYAHVSIGDRSASAWTIDGDDRRFKDLSEAKNVATLIALQRLVRDGFVQPTFDAHVLKAAAQAYAQGMSEQHIAEEASAAFAQPLIDEIKAEQRATEMATAPGLYDNVNAWSAKFMAENLIECAQQAQQWHEAQSDSENNQSHPRMRV